MTHNGTQRTLTTHPRASSTHQPFELAVPLIPSDHSCPLVPQLPHRPLHPILADPADRALHDDSLKPGFERRVRCGPHAGNLISIDVAYEEPTYQ